MGHYLMAEPCRTPGDNKLDEIPKKRAWMSNLAQESYLVKFNSRSNLFIPGADLGEYGRLILKLKSLPFLPFDQQKAIIAYTLLFHRKGRDKQPTVPGFNLLFFNYFIQNCEDSLDIKDLISILTAMVQFWDDNVRWNEMPPPNSKPNFYSNVCLL